MKCLIEVGSKQYPVEKNSTIYINNKKGYKQGQEIVFEKVLYVADEDKFILGRPYIKNAYVSGVIENIVKNHKLQWIKYGKSSFQRKKGYRHKYAQVKIKEIKMSND